MIDPCVDCADGDCDVHDRTPPLFFFTAIAAVCLTSVLSIAPAQAADVPTVQVRICIPPHLVTQEFWENPYPGGAMWAFKNAIKHYVATHGGSGQTEYWIADDAFARFSAANTESSRPDPGTLVQEMSAQSECPASNYTAEQEVDADVPSPTTQASTYSEPAEAVGDASANTSEDITGYVAGAAAAAIMWCVLGGCSSDNGSSNDASSSYDYGPPEDPYNNAYQQYLDEQHAACVWAYSDISNC